MDLKLLIDGIVRQTTVLIAQISTSSGVRSPLSHVVDQVFFELASEIEAQGVKRRVAADMFGLALRAYQKKMRRLTESRSARDRTLWEAVLSLIGEGEVSRQRIEERFKHDGEREVGAVLHDLVRSGLVYATGAGEHAVYGLTSDEVRDRVTQSSRLEGLMNVVWLKVFRGEASSVGTAFFELSDRALEELTLLSRAVDGPAPEVPTCTDCPLDTGSSSILRSDPEEASGMEVISYPSLRPPLELRAVHQFIQSLIDQAKECRGDKLHSCYTERGTSGLPLPTCGADRPLAEGNCGDCSLFGSQDTLNGTTCPGVRCASCQFPASTCGAHCTQPCAGGSPIWDVYCTE